MGERGRNIGVQDKHRSVASCMPPTRNAGMCPDWEQNRWPFSLRSDTQPTETHQSGPNLPFLWGKQQSCWMRAHLNDLILAWLPLPRPYFQIRSQLVVLGFRISVHIFGGTQTRPPQLSNFNSWDVRAKRDFSLGATTAYTPLLWILTMPSLSRNRKWSWKFTQILTIVKIIWVSQVSHSCCSWSPSEMQASLCFLLPWGSTLLT